MKEEGFGAGVLAEKVHNIHGQTSNYSIVKLVEFGLLRGGEIVFLWLK